MCFYCFVADHAFQYNPPWNPSLTSDPLIPTIIPAPDCPPGVTPVIPEPKTEGPHKDWGIEQLREYVELLREARDLEAQLGRGCPAHSKPDYITMFEERIARLEAAAASREVGGDI